MTPRRNARTDSPGGRRIVTDATAAARGSALSNVISGLAGLVVYLVTTGGLFFYAGELQLPLLVGLTVGLSARRTVSAGMVGFASLAAGALLLPPVTLAPKYPSAVLVFVSLGMALLAGAAALITRWLLGRFRQRAGRVLFFGAVALILANLWATSLTVVTYPSTGELSLVDILSAPTMPGTSQSDDKVYLRTQQLMDQGEDFYRAYAQAHSENTDFFSAAPGSVLGFRPPTIFVLRDMLPGRMSTRLMVGLLTLVSVAIIVVVFALSDAVRAPLTIVSAAALSTYFMAWVATSLVAYVDAWAAALGLAAFGVLVFALRDPSRRIAYAVGVALAVVAALSRELLLFLPLAGLASALMSKTQRRFRTLAWTGGLLAIAAGLAAHYAAAARFLSDKPGSAALWLRGGADKLVLALNTATPFVAPRPWVLVLLLAMSLAGVAYFVARRRDTGWFVSTAIALPLLGFLFVANEARAASVSANYWGVIVVPLMLAVIPLAFAWLPGVGKSGPDSSRA